MNIDKKLAGYKAFTRFGLSFIFLSFLLVSCGNGTSFFNLTVKDEVNNPAMERPEGTGTEPNNNSKSTPSVSDISVNLENPVLNGDTPTISIEGIVEGVSVKLREEGCEGEVVSTLDHSGTFEGLESYDEYKEIQYYI